MVQRRTQAERSASTKASLLAAGRELFGEHGFAGAAREEIVERAGVTRGALHHHFHDKEGLFRAVFEDIERELVAAVGTKALKVRGDELTQLRAGCLAFLDACMAPDVQRIAVIDAPSVLGWNLWREIDGHYGLGLVAGGLGAAMNAGLIREQPVQPLAHILLAALNESAMYVAGAAKPRVARGEMGSAIEMLVESLRV